MKEVKLEAKRRKIELLMLPTPEAIKALERTLTKLTRFSTSRLENLCKSLPQTWAFLLTVNTPHFLVVLSDGAHSAIEKPALQEHSFARRERH